MKCRGWQRIACALEEIAANTGQGRDTYDWWAQIWIPALIGLGSLLIGVGALLLTHRAYVYERDARAASDQAARLAERTRIMVLGRRFLLASYATKLGVEGNQDSGERPSELRLELSEEVELSDEPFGRELYLEVIFARDELPDYYDVEADAYAGLVSGAAQMSLREWARDPEQWKKRQAIRKLTIETHLGPVRERYERERKRREARRNED
jgi:hypothetical protein